MLMVGLQLVKPLPGECVKLLIVFPSMERGGAEGYALTMARAAVARGFEVHVASPLAEATEGLVRDFEYAGAVWHALAIARAATVFGRRPKPLVPWVEFIHTLRLLVSLRPSALLIVLPGVQACFPVQAAAAMLRVPAASCFQLTPRAPWRPSHIRARLLRWARARRQAWISVSQHNAEFVSTAFDVPREELHIIPNGAPLHHDTLDRTTCREEKRRDLRLPPDAIIVLTVARLGIQKAHDILLEAVPHLIQHHANTHFVWIGEGEMREKLEQRIKELNVGARVHLLGFRNDVPRWLAACDIFAFPTHYEGLPFSMVEAMAMRLPVAASAVSSIPEVLDGGAAGLLVHPNEPAAWSAAIGSLLDDPRRARLLAATAHSRAQLYSEPRMVEQTLCLLESLEADRAADT